MKTIIYDAFDGLVVSDAHVIKTAKELLNLGNTIKIGSEILLNAFRVLIIRKELDYKDVEFQFTDANNVLHTLKPNEFARFDDWPRGMADYDYIMTLELLKSASKGRSNESRS